MKKSELFFETAKSLLAGEYRWTSPGKCNVGHLITVARGARATGPEFFQGGGPAWRGNFLWCFRGAENSVLKWLGAEFEISRREIESIELLNDGLIVNLLRRRGVRPPGLFNRSRKYVAAYLAVMGEIAARRERKENLAASQAVKKPAGHDQPPRPHALAVA